MIRQLVNYSAIVVTLLVPIGFIILVILVFSFNLPAGLGTGLIYSLFSFPIAVLACYKPRAGGIALLVIGCILLAGSIEKNHYPEYYVPLSSLSILGGLLQQLRRTW